MIDKMILFEERILTFCKSSRIQNSFLEFITNIVNKKELVIKN